jgi:membrane protein
MEPKNSFHSLAELLRATFCEWKEDHCAQLGAALAFYSVFSLTPLLMIAIAIAGLVFGRDAARNGVVEQIRALVGMEAARSIEMMVDASTRPATNKVALAVGIVMLLVGASGVFGQLQDALNVIWEAPTRKGRPLLRMLQDRFLSFTMVLGSGFLLLVSLVISAALTALNDSVARIVSIDPLLLQVLHLIVSFAVTSLLFAMIFKVLPDISIGWNEVWIGAAVTSLLFSIGKVLIGLYLGESGIASVYGAVGSLLILLLWTYYSAQILLFGAEFTQVCANRYRTTTGRARERLSQAGLESEQSGHT